MAPCEIASEIAWSPIDLREVLRNSVITSFTPTDLYDRFM